MLFLDKILFLQWEHKVELTTPSRVIQRIYEEIQVVYLLDLSYKPVNFAEEVFRIHIVQQIDVKFVLSQKLESHTETSFLNEAYYGFQEENTWLDALEIASWHLQNSLVAISQHNA